MTRFTSLSLAAMAALTLSACWNSPEAPEESSPEQEQNDSMNMSFRDLMDLSENFTCTFSDTDEAGNRSEGTVYVEGDEENLRGDFTITEAGGESYEAHVIRKGTLRYVWTSQMDQGFMMDLEEDAPLFGTAEEDEAAIDENESVDFDCDDWSPNDDMFDPPSDVEFLDMSAQMEMMMQNQAEFAPPAGADGSQCAACDQIPDPAMQEQCRAALGC